MSFRDMKFRYFPIFFLAVFIFAGCVGQSVAQNPLPSDTLSAAAEEEGQETSTVLPTPSPQNTATPTSQPTVPQSENTQTPPSNPQHTPTPQAEAEDHLPPEEWRSWPVIPTLSPEMIEVYRRGIELGNDPHHFSKVGDCQIIPKVFLGLYDKGTYNLPEDLEYLEETIDHFSGSFARKGMALKGGFVFPTVFSPLRADSSVCEPGETPLECELRVHNPTFVLISMEFRYEGRTAETHEKYLRKSVEYALSRGIVPILATKADNFEGDHSLNRTTVRIADEYNLPLWNYWRAVQPLPNHGIDWDRDSYGFHVTPDAWLVRSRTFLRTLDALWQRASAAVDSSGGN